MLLRTRDGKFTPLWMPWDLGGEDCSRKQRQWGQRSSQSWLRVREFCSSSYLAPTSPVFSMRMRRVAFVWYTTGPKGMCCWSRETSRAWQQPLRRKRGRRSPMLSMNTSSEKRGTRFFGAKMTSSLQTSLGFSVMLWNGTKEMRRIKAPTLDCFCEDHQRWYVDSCWNVLAHGRCRTGHVVSMVIYVVGKQEEASGSPEHPPWVPGVLESRTALTG
uniref:Uncharacterized protein n=1 Tax=Molossus molossus TaxID=27622 RepID=A0A7J8C929_MOLMO|nr:hypothetical protein HJG59_009949 [Molossus molossus]